MTTPTHQEAVKVLRDEMQRIIDSVPAFQDGGFFIEHYSPDGEPQGCEQVDPVGIIQHLQGIADRALAATSQVEAATSEAVAYVDPQAILNFKTEREQKRGPPYTKEWMWANPDAGLVPVYAASPTLPDEPGSFAEAFVLATAGPQPAPLALPVASVSCPECGFGREHDPSCSRAAQAPLALPAIAKGDAISWDGTTYHGIEEIYHHMEEGEALHMWLDDQKVPRVDKAGPTYSLVGRVMQLQAAQAKPDLSGLTIPPIPEMESEQDIDYLKGAPDDWDEDYKSTWKKLQVAARNKSQWRAYALQLRALLAHPVAQAKPEGDGWQPIETAPRDRMIMLGCLANEEEDRAAISTPGRWHQGFEDAPDDIGHDGGFMDSEFQQFSYPRSFGAESYRTAGLQPTHWRNLPAPPAAIKPERGEL